MLKRLLLIFLSLTLIGMVQLATAGIDFGQSDINQRKAAIALVKKAAELVKKEGRVKAICAFNEQNKKAKPGAPFLFAFVCNDGKNDSIVLANRLTHIVFTSLYNNPNHIKFRKALKKHPNGVWVSYTVTNPDSGKIENKLSYLVMLPKHKICIGSGYFIR